MLDASAGAAACAEPTFPPLSKILTASVAQLRGPGQGAFDQTYICPTARSAGPAAVLVHIGVTDADALLSQGDHDEVAQRNHVLGGLDHNHRELHRKLTPIGFHQIRHDGQRLKTCPPFPSLAASETAAAGYRVICGRARG
jgi:hypothetical protein